MTRAMPAAAVCAAVLIAATACGAYSPLAQGEEPTGASASSARPAATSPSSGTIDVVSTPPPSTPSIPPVSYAWTLPKSDTSVNNFQDGPAYGALQLGDCDGAAAYLAPEKFTDDPDFGVYILRSPRFVVLLAAGVAMCRGAEDEARARYRYAIETWGTSGLDRPIHPISTDNAPEPVSPPWRRGNGEPECDLYRALTSTLESVAPDTVACPGGLLPLHHYVLYPVADGTVTKWDDPLSADIDESLTPPDDWTGDPSTPGTSFQEGQPMTGALEDEFGEDPQP